MKAESKHGTSSGNLGSHGEAVNAMLQGLKSSEVELAQG